MFDILFPKNIKNIPDTAWLGSNHVTVDITAYLEYRHPDVKDALQKLKYRAHAYIADIIGKTIAPTLRDDLQEIQTMEGIRQFALIPIPITRTRNRERGYNQSALLAQVLQREMRNISSRVVENVLVRSYNDPKWWEEIFLGKKKKNKQTECKTRKERLGNVQGAFTVQHQEKIVGAHVVLIDDITTTGATLREARNVLMRAGARSVFALAIAH